MDELMATEAVVDRLWGIFDNLWPALLLLVFGWWLVKQVRKLCVKALAKRMDESAAHFLGQIVHALLLIVLFIAVLSQLGVNTTSLLAALGAAGLAVGLALKDSLQNLASGFLLVALKPFKKGDYIEGAGTGGSVERMAMMHTYLKTPDNKVVMIPNSSLVGSNLVNYSTEPQRRMDIRVGISYDDDLRKAKQLLLDLVAADERALKDPEPRVIITDFGDNSVNLSLRVWATLDDFWFLQWDLMEEVKLSFDANGITIPFPQRDIHHYQH
ncbi:mechanosensitive ion channel family protein [Marinospirillum perlucidum]|uniref:mechanosensitive ion channel family protein n=1 Tax=Marinospirillum perlucidum TaxID=1982602 RepID=UPI001C49AF53|nr:mechanosensitive ion channel domain-containing protein [Marinospirillum perlucidum]